MTGFISDIHGNYPALSAVIDVLEKKGVGEIYSLGDVAGYYPMINECINLLAAHSVKNILGNHDNYLVNNIECSRSVTVNSSILYQRGIITPENLTWLSASGMFYHYPSFFSVHGGLNDYLEEYTEIPDFSGFPVGVSLFLCGHTHKQLYAEKDGRRFCNPGSVGQPRDNDPRAAFAILQDNGEIELCRTEYDINKTAEAAKNAGFKKRVYCGLFTGSSIQPGKEYQP